MSSHHDSPYRVSHDDHAMTLTDADAPVGRLDWRLESGIVYVDYVHVDPARRGHGLGARLVDAAADYARQTGRRLVPLCGFARRVLHGDPRYQDLLADD
ncbi:MAG: GNAT family N-acetyltransferase [Vicinamibacterales bacterium]